MRSLVLGAVLLASLVRAAAAAPQGAATYISSAENRYRNGDVEGAIADLTAALALDPRSLEALRDRAFIRIQRLPPGPLDAGGVQSARLALADLSQALQIDPRSGGNLAFRASLKARIGDPAGALADGTQAIALDRNLYLAHSVVMSLAWDAPTAIRRSRRPRSARRSRRARPRPPRWCACSPPT